MFITGLSYDWNFEDCLRPVRGRLIYRAFCRIDCEAVSDDRTLIRLAQALGPDVLKRILKRLVEVARRRRLVRGQKLRVDTTVVEANIHYPADSTLLREGVRVITRTLYRIRQVVGQLRFRDRTRSIARRTFQVVLASRKVRQDPRAGVKKVYRWLMGTMRAVLREARRAVNLAQRRAKKLASAC